jgi:hypothetical protein
MALEAALLSSQMQQQQGQMLLPGLPMGVPGGPMLVVSPQAGVPDLGLAAAPPPVPPPLGLASPQQPTPPLGLMPGGGPPQTMVLPAQPGAGGLVPMPLSPSGGTLAAAPFAQPPGAPSFFGAPGGSGGGGGGGGATLPPLPGSFHQLQQQEQQQQQQQLEGVGSDGGSGTPAAPTSSEVARAREVLGARIASLQAFVAEHQLRELHLAGEQLLPHLASELFELVAAAADSCAAALDIGSPDVVWPIPGGGSAGGGEAGPSTSQPGGGGQAHAADKQRWLQVRARGRCALALGLRARCHASSCRGYP